MAPRSTVTELEAAVKQLAQINGGLTKVILKLDESLRERDTALAQITIHLPKQLQAITQALEELRKRIDNPPDAGGKVLHVEDLHQALDDQTENLRLRMESITSATNGAKNAVHQLRRSMGTAGIIDEEVALGVTLGDCRTCLHGLKLLEREV